MSDPVVSFIDFMRSVNCAPADSSEIIDDDKRRRFRLEGDKPKTRNGSYQLKVEPDGFACGWVKSFKEGSTHAWHSKSDRKADEAQRAEWRRRASEAKAERASEEALLAERAAAKAVRIWAASSTDGSTPYLERKGSFLHGARVWRDMVVVPMWRAGKLSGLQFISGDGSKRFLTGAAKAGAYFPIALPDEDKSVIVLCEGFATGTALRESVGFPIIVAFDAGNLKPVAQAIRKKYPDSLLVIAGDNDQWTAKQDGTPYNPGVEGAQQAAVAVGGARVIVPLVPVDDEDRRTDWDDIWRTDGPDAVRMRFDPVGLQVAANTPADPETDFPPVDEMMEYAPTVLDDEPFRCLGHDDGSYYFLPSCNGGQVVEIGATGLGSMTGLLRIHSSYDYWVTRFGGANVSDRKAATMAAAALMDACHRAGVFRPEVVRGAGAWRDGVVMVVNDGRSLHVDGQKMPIYAWQGINTYTADAHVYDYDADQLSSQDAVKLRTICNGLQWTNPLFGDLFAGWLAVAPFASCLRWRSHGWLTGPSGGGKSWIIANIVRPMLGRSGIIFEKATEASVRAKVGKSGRPLVLDEAEAEEQDQRVNLQKILHLARVASSGGNVANAYDTFTAASSFLFASINVAAQHAADENRITQFVLSGDKRADKAVQFAAMRELVRETITPDFVLGMQARVMHNLDALYDNEETFRSAAAELFGRQRNADQLAPMIAGLYLLTSTARITHDKAVEWLKARDWSWHATQDEDSDAHNFVRQLMTSRARYDAHGIGREATIGQMVEVAANREHSSYTDVANGLRALGIKVEDDKIWIANKSPGIAKLMERTSWPTWYRTLGDYPGADNADNKTVWFATGLVSKVKRIPLAAVLEHQPATIDEEVPW